MQAASAATCPFKAKTVGIPRYKIQFTPLTKRKWITRLLSDVQEFLSRFSFASIRTAWKIGTNNDLSECLSQSWRYGNLVSRLPTPEGSLYLTAEPQVMRAIFQNPRAERDGVFLDHENKRLFIEGVVKEIYPEEVAKYGIDKIAEMVVFTAQYPGIKSLRSSMMTLLGINCIEEYEAELNKIAADLLDSLSTEEQNHCNAELLTFEFTIMVICKYMTGYHATRSHYQALAQAMAHMTKRITSIISRRPLSRQDNDDIKRSFKLLREVIDENIADAKDIPFIQNMRDAGWDDCKIRMTLLFLYFTGTETTSAVMNYLLWQLGRSENKQCIADLRDPEKHERMLPKIIAETLRLHPPAFIEGRQLREDTLLEIYDEQDRVLKKMLLKRRHSILCLSQPAAMDPVLYENPSLFNPYRFDEVPSPLPWYPFAAGTHVCPGQYLANAELMALITQLVSKYDLETLVPANSTIQRGYFTLRSTPAILRLTPLKT